MRYIFFYSIGKFIHISIRFIRRFFPNYIIKKAELLIENNKEQHAKKLLEHTFQYQFDNKRVFLILLEIYKKNKEWEKITKTYNKLNIKNIDLTLSNYIDVIEAYLKLGKNEKAKDIILEILELYPNNNKIYEKLIDVYLQGKNWYKVIELLEKNALYNKLSIDYSIYLLMLNIITGRHLNANKLFKYLNNNFYDEISNDSLGYRKLVLFDNGHSRIEYYKKIKKLDRLIITFDSINMQWENPSFAFKFLNSKNVDIIAIRKKKKKVYQQDLTQEDFLKTVSKIVSFYDDRLAYGFSLGAYNALYFASRLNCRILSIAPRLSIHPLYGKPKIIPKFEFKQDLHLPQKNNLKPIIIYDPKNKLDYRYVHEEVLRAFPNAILLKTPYSGHGVAPFLAETNQLKSVVTDFINNTTPTINRIKRQKSATYYRNLASKCLQHNKPTWALKLVNRSLEIKPDERLTIKVKINVLRTLNMNQEAINLLIKKINQYPNILTYRNLLIDTYLSINNYDKAKNELIIALKKLGYKPSLKKRKDLIYEKLPETNKVTSLLHIS